ncbi:HlyD family secretion protein [Bradyrhizobium oligotrophicum]|uniref:HlyD family secretion protein n=1 Tax=Bradyrhizobium oligotrophicum TaxID=44255 RepID=UPI003EC09E56
MPKLKRALLAAIVAALLAGIVIYDMRLDESAPPIVGVVRATELSIEPELGGRLASMSVRKGARVRAGDVVATLSAMELTAQLDQARAALALAAANRDHVHAGVRREQIDSLKSEIAKAGARLDYVQAQLTRTSTLARQNFESQQALDQVQNDSDIAAADVARARANYEAAVAGPTPEERAIADSQVRAASAALVVLERRLDKMVLRAPADGVVSVVAAEVGENIRAGQAVLTIEATGKEWLSFNLREDDLDGLTVGKDVNVGRTGGTLTGRVTELRRLGAFATWQARRVVGDHDRSTLRLRVDPSNDMAELEPGMTVWIGR